MQVRLLCATAVDKESNACSVGGGTGSPRKLGMLHCSFTDNSCVGARFRKIQRRATRAGAWQANRPVKKPDVQLVFDVPEQPRPDASRREGALPVLLLLEVRVSQLFKLRLPIIEATPGRFYNLVAFSLI